MHKIRAHLQQTITKTVDGKAKCQKGTAKIWLSNNALVFDLKTLGINKQWTSSSSLIDILKLQTEFIKDTYLGSATDLEFKLNA